MDILVINKGDLWVDRGGGTIAKNFEKMFYKAQKAPFQKTFGSFGHLKVCGERF